MATYDAPSTQSLSHSPYMFMGLPTWTGLLPTLYIYLEKSTPHHNSMNKDKTRFKAQVKSIPNLLKLFEPTLP